MEFQDAGNTAAGVIAVVTDDESSRSLQSMEFGDSQSTNEELTAVVGNGAGMYESNEDVKLHSEKPNRPGESAQEDQVPSQDTSALDDGDSSKHLRKAIPVCSSVAPDCCSQRETGTEETFLVSLPGNVSLSKGRQNTEMGIDPSLDNYQRDIDAAHREENASASENSARDHPTDRLGRGAFTPKLLQETMLKACLALEEEKQAEERALTEISYCLERVFSKYAEVKSSAVALFNDTDTVEESVGGVRYQASHFEGSFVTLDNRHKTVEDYVRVVYAEALNQGDAYVFDRRLKTKDAYFANQKNYRSPSKIVNTAYLTRGRSYNRKENFRRNRDKRHTAVLVQLLHFAADVRNEIMGQYRTLTKLCAVVYEYVCKIEVSCRIVLNTVKSVANVVRPALESMRIVHRALNSVSVREIPDTRRSATPGDDSTLPAKWAQLALTHAETAIRLHDEVALILTEAQKQLESLKLNVSVGRDVHHYSNDFEKYVLDLIQQPGNINFDELREKQTKVAFLRDILTSIWEEMMRCPDHIISSSERSSSAVEKVLLALTSATENSCSAMEKSMDALINVAVSKRIEESNTRA